MNICWGWELLEWSPHVCIITPVMTPQWRHNLSPVISERSQSWHTQPSPCVTNNIWISLHHSSLCVSKNVKSCKFQLSLVFTEACVGQAGSQEPKWWMKRGFCLIIGIINSRHSLAQPVQPGTNYRLSPGMRGLGLELNHIWKVNNSWQTIRLPSLSIGHTCHVSGALTKWLMVSQPVEIVFSGVVIFKCHKISIILLHKLLLTSIAIAAMSRYYWSGL